MTDQPEKKLNIPAGASGITSARSQMNYESDDASMSSDEELITKKKKKIKNNDDGPRRMTPVGGSAVSANTASIDKSSRVPSIHPPSASSQNPPFGNKGVGGLKNASFSTKVAGGSNSSSAQVDPSSSGSSLKIKISRPNLSTLPSSTKPGNINTNAAHSSPSKVASSPSSNVAASNAANSASTKTLHSTTSTSISLKNLPTTGKKATPKGVVASNPLPSSMTTSSNSGHSGMMSSSSAKTLPSSSLKTPAALPLTSGSTTVTKKKKKSSAIHTTSIPTVPTTKNVSKTSALSASTVPAHLPGPNTVDTAGSSGLGTATATTSGGDISVSSSGAKRKRKKTSKKLPSASDVVPSSNESVGGGSTAGSLSSKKQSSTLAPSGTTRITIPSSAKTSSGSTTFEASAVVLGQPEKKKKKKKQQQLAASGGITSSSTSQFNTETVSKSEKKKLGSSSTSKHSSSSAPSAAAKMISTSTSKIASHGVSSKKSLSGPSGRKKTSKKKLASATATLPGSVGGTHVADASAVDASDESDGGMPGAGVGGVVGGSNLSYYSSRDGGGAGANPYRGQYYQHSMSSAMDKSQAIAAMNQVASAVVSAAAGGGASGYGYSAAQTAVNDMMRRALEENQYSAMGSIVDTESSDEDEGEAVLVPTNASRRLDQMEQWWCRAQFRNQTPEALEGGDGSHRMSDKKEATNVSSHPVASSSCSVVTPMDTSSGSGAVATELANGASLSSSLLGGEGEANVTTQQTHMKLDRGVMIRAMKKRLRLEALKHASIRTSAGSPVHVNVNAMIGQAAAHHREMQREYLMEQRQQSEEKARNAKVSSVGLSAPMHNRGQVTQSVQGAERSTTIRQTIPVSGGSRGSGGALLYGRQVPGSSHHLAKLQQPFVVPSVAAVLGHADLVNLYTPEERLEQERSKLQASLAMQHGDEGGVTSTECQEADGNALPNALATTGGSGGGAISSHVGQVGATGKRKKRKGGRKKKTAVPSGSVVPGVGALTSSSGRVGDDVESLGAMSADEDDFYDHYDENENRNLRETSRLVKLHRLGISRTEVVTPDGLTVALFPGVAGSDGTVPVLSDDVIEAKDVGGLSGLGNWWSGAGGNVGASSSRSGTATTRGGTGGVGGDLSFQFGSAGGSVIGGGGGVNGPSSNATWVKCDYCEKWRKLRGIVDSKKLNSSAKWDCSMNQSDPERSKCTAPEEEYDAPAGDSRSNGPVALAEQATRKNLHLWLRRLHNNDAFEARLPPVTRSQKMKQKQQQQLNGNDHQKGGASVADATALGSLANSNLHNSRDFSDGSRNAPASNEFLYSHYKKKVSAAGKDKRKEEDYVNSVSLFEQYAEPYEWIRCCNPTCGKWRSLLKGMDSKTILDKAKDGKWYCVLNTWDEKMASCSAPQENLPVLGYPKWLVRDIDEEDVGDNWDANEDEDDQDTATNADQMEEEESDENPDTAGDDDDEDLAASAHGKNGHSTKKV